MSTTQCPAETQAAQDLREFAFDLPFIEGEVSKTVCIIHPEWDAAKLVALLRQHPLREDPEKVELDECDAMCLMDACAFKSNIHVWQTRGGRRGKILVATVHVFDSSMMANTSLSNVTFTAFDGVNKKTIEL